MGIFKNMGGNFPGGSFPDTGKTLLHQRRSEATVRRCFTKCSWTFCRIHEKTLVLESFFNKVAGLKRPQHKCFPMIFVKFSRAPYNKTPYTIKIANGLSKSTTSAR